MHHLSENREFICWPLQRSQLSLFSYRWDTRAGLAERSEPDKPDTQCCTDSQAGGHYKKRNEKGMGDGCAAVTVAQHAVKMLPITATLSAVLTIILLQRIIAAEDMNLMPFDFLARLEIQRAHGNGQCFYFSTSGNDTTIMVAQNSCQFAAWVGPEYLYVAGIERVVLHQRKYNMPPFGLKIWKVRSSTLKTD